MEREDAYVGGKTTASPITSSVAEREMVVTGSGDARGELLEALEREAEREFG